MNIFILVLWNIHRVSASPSGEQPGFLPHCHSLTHPRSSMSIPFPTAFFLGLLPSPAPGFLFLNACLTLPEPDVLQPELIPFSTRKILSHWLFWTSAHKHSYFAVHMRVGKTFSLHLGKQTHKYSQ